MDRSRNRKARTPARGRSTAGQNRPSLRADTARATTSLRRSPSLRRKGGSTDRTSSSPMVQRRNVTDLGIRRASSSTRSSPTHNSPRRGRSPARGGIGRGTTPVGRAGSQPVGRSTRSESWSPSSKIVDTSGKSRKPVKDTGTEDSADSTPAKTVKTVKAPVIPVTRSSPRAKVWNPLARSSPLAKAPSPLNIRGGKSSGQSPRSSPRASAKKTVSPPRGKVEKADSSKLSKDEEEKRKSVQNRITVNVSADKTDKNKGIKPGRKSATQLTRSPNKQKSPANQGTNSGSDSTGNNSAELGAASETASKPASPTPSERSSVYDFELTDQDSNAAQSSPGIKRCRNVSSSPEKQTDTQNTVGSVVSKKPTVRTDQSKSQSKPEERITGDRLKLGTYVTLEDGSDVTKNLHELAVGTSLVITREDGATMKAIWNGHMISTTPQPSISKEDVELDMELEEAVNMIQAMSSKSPAKLPKPSETLGSTDSGHGANTAGFHSRKNLRTSKVISKKSGLVRAGEKNSSTSLSVKRGGMRMRGMGQTRSSLREREHSPSDDKQTYTCIRRRGRDALKVPTEDSCSENYVCAQSYESVCPTGCGRCGARRQRDQSDWPLANRERLHITLVNVGSVKARSLVLSRGRGRRGRGRGSFRGRGRGEESQRMSPSAKAFIMSHKTVQSAKLSSPKCVQSDDSYDENSLDTKKKTLNELHDDVTEAHTVQIKEKTISTRAEDTGELEVKIVPKFPTDGAKTRNIRGSKRGDSDDESIVSRDSVESDEIKIKKRGRPRKSYPILDREKEEDRLISPRRSTGKKVTISEDAVHASNEREALAVSRRVRRSVGLGDVSNRNVTGSRGNQTGLSNDPLESRKTITFNIQGSKGSDLTGRGKSVLRSPPKTEAVDKAKDVTTKEATAVLSEKEKSTTKDAIDKPMKTSVQLSLQGAKLSETSKRFPDTTKIREARPTVKLNQEISVELNKTDLCILRSPDRSEPSGKLVRSKVFRKALDFRKDYVQDVSVEYRAVVVPKTLPTKLLKTPCFPGVKVDSSIKIQPSKVTLTKLEVSPEEALSRLLKIEAMLNGSSQKKEGKTSKLEKTGNKQDKVSSTQEAGKKRRGRPKFQQQEKKKESSDDAENEAGEATTFQKMLAQHVVPMRRTISESASSHGSRVNVELSEKEPIMPKKTATTVSETVPAKRQVRLRTDSWTISESKAVHAATAVAVSPDGVTSCDESDVIAEETAEIAQPDVDDNRVKYASVINILKTDTVSTVNERLSEGHLDEDPSPIGISSDSSTSGLKDYDKKRGLSAKDIEKVPDQGNFSLNVEREHLDIPSSDSMPELSKICEQHTVLPGNLPVPKLTPVEEITFKKADKVVSDTEKEVTGQVVDDDQESVTRDKKLQQTQVMQKPERVGGEESMVDIESEVASATSEVSNQLLTEIGKPVDDVVVLATWSVSSEDEELDVMGTTAESIDDKVLETYEKEVSIDSNKEIIKPHTETAQEVSTLVSGNELDNVLKDHISVEDIEKDIVIEVKKQIDDLVTAVEMNKSKEDERDRRKEVTSFNEYCRASVGDTLRPISQLSEGSERFQSDISQDSLESGSGGFDIQLGNSPVIPIGLMSTGSPTEHLDRSSLEDYAEEGLDEKVNIERNDPPNEDRVTLKVENDENTSQGNFKFSMVSELNLPSCDNLEKEDTIHEQSKIDSATSKSLLETKNNLSVLPAKDEHITSCEDKSDKFTDDSNNENSMKTAVDSKRDSGKDCDASEINNESEVTDKPITTDLQETRKQEIGKSKVWMHIRKPKELATAPGSVTLDCHREFQKAVSEEKDTSDNEIKKQDRSRTKSGTPNLTGRKRRELNRLKTDMVGAEDVFESVQSGDEDGGVQRRTRRAKRHRSPEGLEGEDTDTHKKARSESRELSPGDGKYQLMKQRGKAKSQEREVKRRVPRLAKLARAALPPGTDLKCIPGADSQKPKNKNRSRKSPWTISSGRRRGRGGRGVRSRGKPVSTLAADALGTSEDEEFTESEADTSQNLSAVENQGVPIKQQHESTKEDSIEPEIRSRLKPESGLELANRPPSKYHIPSPTRMKTRGKRTNVLSMVHDLYEEDSPEKELCIPVKPQQKQVSPAKAEPKAAQTQQTPDEAGDNLADSDYSDLEELILSGTVEELQQYCKPCSVFAVDFIRCLDLENLKKSPGSGSPGSARGALSPRISGPRRVALGASQDTSYHMDSSTEEDDNDAGDANNDSASPRKLKTGVTKELKMSPPLKRLKPDGPTTAYEAQFLSFLKAPQSDISECSTSALISSTRVKRQETVKEKPKEILSNVELEQKQDPGQKSVKSKFVCKHCTYTSNSRPVIAEHIYNHTSVVPYTCGYCSAIFGTKSGVMTHNKREHKQSPPMVLKTTEIRESDHYEEQPVRVSQIRGPGGIKRKAESDSADTAVKRKPTARKSITKPKSQVKISTSIVASLLQSPPMPVRDATGSTRDTPSPASSGSLKMKFSFTADKKEAIVMSGPSISGDDAVNRKSINKVTPRPRIPKIETVDPNRPYYQCRHCTLATHNLPLIEKHVNDKHSEDQRYVCPLCDLAYCKYEEGMRKHFQKWHPGQPVMLMLQPLFYDTKDSNTRGVNSKSLDKDANVVQVLNKKRLAEAQDAAAVEDESRSNSNSPALQIDIPEEEADNAKRSVSPLILKVPSIVGRTGNSSKTGKKGGVVKGGQLAPDSEKRDNKKKSPSPSDYMCKEISSTSGDNMEPVDDGEGDANDENRSSTPVHLTRKDAVQDRKMGTPTGRQKANRPQPTAKPSPEGIPGLQIVNVMSLAVSDQKGTSVQQQKEIFPQEGELMDEDDEVVDEFVDRTIHECKHCGERYEDLDQAISHIDLIHQLEYWYACPYCPFGCSKHKNNMIRHIRRAHPTKPEKRDIGLINQENHLKTHKIKVSVKALQRASTSAQPTILHVPDTFRKPGQQRPTEQKGTSAGPVNAINTSTVSVPPVGSESADGEDDDELIFVSAEPGKARLKQQRPPFRGPFGRGNRMVPQFGPPVATQRPALRHPVIQTDSKRIVTSPGKTASATGGANATELEMDCESVDDSYQYDDAVTEDSDYIISTNESQIITVSGPSDESPQDLSRGNSRENTPERGPQATRTSLSAPGISRAPVLNVPSVRPRLPPPAHRGSPHLTSPSQSDRSGKGAGKTGGTGSPGLAPLEQLTAGIGKMPPPLSKATATSTGVSSNQVAPRPAHTSKPMPPLLHVPSGRLTGPPQLKQAPPRLTPGVVRGVENTPVVARQAPPLQRAPSPAHSSASDSSGYAPRISSRLPLGRGNPSVAVVQPMPPPPPPTPPERNSPIDAGGFTDEEEAKRAFSVFNIGPNRMRAPNVTNSAVSLTAPPRVVAPVVTTPSEPEMDFSQFQVRPGPRSAPRYPTHAAGFGMTPPNLRGTASHSTNQRQPPPYCATQAGNSPQTVTQQGTSEGQPQQFICPYCPYEGPGSSALKNHILTHQPNIQWICPYCPGPTRMTKTEVTSHIQAAHPACQLVYIPFGVQL